MINKIIGTTLHALAAIVWFGILIYYSNLVDVLAALAVAGLTSTFLGFGGYKFIAHEDIEVMNNLMQDHRVGVSLITAAILWLAPAFIQGPWVSAVALGSASALTSAGNYFIARWARYEAARHTEPFF